MSSSNPKKFDITRELPDELLCYILSFVTSIPEKLGLAVVSSKFKRCVFTQLQQPTTLEIDFIDGLLNGHIPAHKWCTAVKVYTSRLHFNKISIVHQRYWTIKFNEQRNTLDQLLAAVDPDCLEQVKIFESGLPCDQANVLEAVISKCDKLSVARLRYCLSPVMLDLSAALKNKPLTELELQLYEYSQEQLVHLFRSLRPHSLNKVQLGFLRMPQLDLALLLKKSAETWGALQEFRIYFRHTPSRCNVIDPKIIARLLSLKHFCILGEEFNWAKLTACLLAVFQNSKRSQPLTVQFEGTSVSSCEIMHAISGVRKSHRDEIIQVVQVDANNMKILLGNVSFASPVSPVNCQRHRNCVSFYPNVFPKLHCKIEQERSGHLEKYKLARCKIGSFAEELNELVEHNWNQLKVLYVDVDKANDLAVITVEEPIGAGEHQYYVTVRCDRCLDSACLGCLNI